MTDILIVVDMQNDFITGPLGTPEAREIVPSVRKMVEGWDGHVIVTLDTHRQDRYPVSHEGRHLPVPHCFRYTEGWLAPRELTDAYACKKVQYIEKESFGSLDLIGKVLSATASNRPRLFICGVCTDICVVSNALILRAQYPESDIYVVEDCCAGTTPENHASALAVLKACHVDVVRSDEVPRLD